MKFFRQQLDDCQCKHNFRPVQNSDMFLPCMMAEGNLSVVDFFYSWLFTKR
jgi:hypothetical protein